jgi:hypothetical protein
MLGVCTCINCKRRTGIEESDLAERESVVPLGLAPLSGQFFCGSTIRFTTAGTGV